MVASRAVPSKVRKSARRRGSSSLIRCSARIRVGAPPIGSWYRPSSTETYRLADCCGTSMRRASSFTDIPGSAAIATKARSCGNAKSPGTAASNASSRSISEATTLPACEIELFIGFSLIYGYIWHPRLSRKPGPLNRFSKVGSSGRTRTDSKAAAAPMRAPMPCRPGRLMFGAVPVDCYPEQHAIPHWLR